MSTASPSATRWLTIIGPVVVIGLWECASMTNFVDPILFPPPHRIAARGIALLAPGQSLSGDLTATLLRLGLTAALAGSVGLFTGTVLALWRDYSSSIEAILVFFYPIPSILFLPFVTFIIGRNEAAIVGTAFITPFIVMSLGTAGALAQVEGLLVDAGRNYGTSGRRLFVKVLLPAALPAISTAFRVSLGLGLISVVATEMVLASEGLGATLWYSWQVLRIVDMYVALAAVAAVGIVISNGYDAVQRRLLPWRLP